MPPPTPKQQVELPQMVHPRREQVAGRPRTTPGAIAALAPHLSVALPMTTPITPGDGHQQRHRPRHRGPRPAELLGERLQEQPEAHLGAEGADQQHERDGDDHPAVGQTASVATGTCMAEPPEDADAAACCQRLYRLGAIWSNGHIQETIAAALRARRAPRRARRPALCPRLPSGRPLVWTHAHLGRRHPHPRRRRARRSHRDRARDPGAHGRLPHSHPGRGGRGRLHPGLVLRSRRAPTSTPTASPPRWSPASASWAPAPSSATGCRCEA